MIEAFIAALCATNYEDPEYVALKSDEKFLETLKDFPLEFQFKIRQALAESREKRRKERIEEQRHQDQIQAQHEIASSIRSLKRYGY